jgi:hypothetical protein
MSNTFPTVIFCQAPADLKYALALYEQRRAVGPVLFVTLEVEGMKQFLEFLPLAHVGVRHVACPVQIPSLRRWRGNLALRRWMHQLQREVLWPLAGTEVYYFSNEIDWVAPACMAYLARRNRVIWRPYHKYTCVPTVMPWRHQALLRIYRWISGADFEWRQVEGSPYHRHILWFCFDRYGIERRPFTEDTSAVLQAYAHRLPLPVGQRNALVFENPEENISDDYETIMRQVFQMLVAAGYTVLIKPHPRVGCSPFVASCPVQMMPAFIPGEFFLLDQFDLVLGLTSSALGYMAHGSEGQVFSLAKLFRARDPRVMDYGINYVSKVAGGRLPFVASLDELKMVIHQRVGATA